MRMSAAVKPPTFIFPKTQHTDDMTFYSIVEKWCAKYKPMRHNPQTGNIRFMFTDSYQGMVEFAKGISNMQSPCVVMESAVEGDGTLARPVFNYPVYFFVRAEKMADGNAAAAAKLEALRHARNFVVWLLTNYRREQDEGSIDGDFARLDLENTQLYYQSVGPIENAWFGVLLQFYREEPLNLCIDENLYDK